MRRNLDSSPRRKSSVLTSPGDEDRTGVNVLSMAEQAHCVLIEGGQFTSDNVEPNIELFASILLEFKDTVKLFSGHAIAL